MNMLRSAAIAAVSLAPLCAVPVHASPASDVLMTVTTSEGSREYDLAALQALPQTEFTTSTIWTEGEQEFGGVLLSDLLEDAGITEGSIMATAINDYAVQIPLDEVDDIAPIVAYHLNGETMSVRDKGPLWIVYPYDLSVDYQTEINYSRSIWQLDRIVQAD
ncbi:molybdopterin-dependent oxidoreductase [Paracoccus sp. R86501]|uniref:molybdopterin-dependent oxidoreductase n=1 Tax=Paracoccus sp. R86501 TaxID=3101711 RepID=UPI0036711528